MFTCAGKKLANSSQFLNLSNDPFYNRDRNDMSLRKLLTRLEEKKER